RAPSGARPRAQRRRSRARHGLSPAPARPVPRSGMALPSPGVRSPPARRPPPPPPPEPEAAAAAARLRYVSDEQPGYRRRRRGKGFSYHASDGALLTDERVRARIDTLAIPPAWQEVWICPLPNGHIQATGRDDAGRKQYVYHPRWVELRDAVKFASL